jgi:hypothetical protein
MQKNKNKKGDHGVLVARSWREKKKKKKGISVHS